MIKCNYFVEYRAKWREGQKKCRSPVYSAKMLRLYSSGKVDPLAKGIQEVSYTDLHVKNILAAA